MQDCVTEGKDETNSNAGLCDGRERRDEVKCVIVCRKGKTRRSQMRDCVKEGKDET